MRSMAAPRMSLVSCVELDAYTFQLSVIERWTEKRWFRTIEHERQATYTIAIRVGRFHDGEHYILRQDARHFASSNSSQSGATRRSSDAYIELDGAIEHVLPPVPGLPSRVASMPPKTR